MYVLHHISERYCFLKVAWFRVWSCTNRYNYVEIL